MRPSLVLAALALAGASQLPAAVKLSSAVNGASYLNSALPNGKLAQGVLFTAFGSGMGPASIVRANKFPLPTELANTSIEVTVNGMVVKCIMLYTTAGQVAAILPSSTPIGNGTMVVSYNGESSPPLSITVVAHAFGIFAVNQGGSGPGVFTDPETNAANSLVNAVIHGRVLDIWGTGLGGANGDDAAGPLPGNRKDINVEAYVGGKPAKVLYVGRSGCCAGIDQIRIQIPDVTGCYLPVYVVVEGVVSNFTSMSVAQSGNTCSDSGGYSQADLQAATKNGGLKLGTVYVGRSRGRTVSGQVNNVTGSLGAGFVRISLDSLLASPGQAPVGTCWLTQFPTTVPPSPAYLEAGKVSSTGPIGTYDLPVPAGYKGVYILSFIPGAPAGYPNLIGDGTQVKPGTYTFTGTGGADVGAFTASVTAPLAFNWNEYETVQSVDRGSPLTVTWTGGIAGAYVSIQGQSPTVSGIGTAFTCLADAAAGAFTVPASILSALPVTYVNERGRPQGSLSVVQFATGDRFSVPGVDYAVTQQTDGADIGNIGYR